jgi:hypothetical protein
MMLFRKTSTPEKTSDHDTELGQDPEARCPCCPVLVASVNDIMLVDHDRSGSAMNPLSKGSASELVQRQHPGL